MRRIYLPVFAGLLSATSAQAGFNEARQAFIDGQYDVAYRELVPLADAGDPRSQIGMGLLHAKGLGVTQDNVAAYVWFDRVLDRDEPLHPVLRTLAETNRSYLARHMTTDQLEEALSRVRERPDDTLRDVATRKPEAPLSHPARADRAIMLASTEPNHAVEAAALNAVAIEPHAGGHTNAIMAAPYNLQAALFPPAGKAQATPPAPTRRTDGIRIQIGAYKGVDTGEVNTAWARIRAKQPQTFAALEPIITRVTLGERGEFHRLQLGPFADLGSAKTMCAKLRASQQDCFVVAGDN